MIIQVGDCIRFSTELLMQIEANPLNRTQIVEVLKIEEDPDDGTKTIYVCNVDQ